jgi:hypothetical protein
MRLRFLPLALLIGAGLVLPVQTPALAKKPNYTHKFKAKKYKPKKYKAHKVKKAKRQVTPVRH